MKKSAKVQQNRSVLQEIASKGATGRRRLDLRCMWPGSRRAHFRLSPTLKRFVRSICQADIILKSMSWSSIRSWRLATRSRRFPPWSASCPSRCARSSAICAIPNGPWLGYNYDTPLRKSEADRKASSRC